VARFLFVEYHFKRVGVGLRKMGVHLTGTNDAISQELDLTLSFVTVGYRFLEGLFSVPRLDSGMGISFGRGYADMRLTTKNNEAVVARTINRVSSSRGAAEMAEWYIDAVSDSDWGFRLGLFGVRTRFEEGTHRSKADTSSAPSAYLSILWRLN